MSPAKWFRLQWDRVLAVTLVVAGMIMLIIGWFGVSGSDLPVKQLPYIISGGLGGLLTVGIGSTLWLSADLRDEWRKLDQIEEAILHRRSAPDVIGSQNGRPGPESEPSTFTRPDVPFEAATAGEPSDVTAETV